MSTQFYSPYTHKKLDEGEMPYIGNKWTFVGVDLAPNNTLETGVAAITRQRELVRMDKVSNNKDVVTFVKSFGPVQNTIVALDVPKSLDIEGKWRQQEVKMHPLRLNSEEDYKDRCAERTWEIYRELEEAGALPFTFFSHLAKLNYEMHIPFRTRTPQGCRALQSAIKQSLKLKNMPTNLSPSSVLDAMVAAYTAWLLYDGAINKDFSLYLDTKERYYMEAIRK